MTNVGDSSPRKDTPTVAELQDPFDIVSNLTCVCGPSANRARVKHVGSMKQRRLVNDMLGVAPGEGRWGMFLLYRPLLRYQLPLRARMGCDEEAMPYQGHCGPGSNLNVMKNLDSGGSVC